jgi:hypothetical protein
MWVLIDLRLLLSYEIGQILLLNQQQMKQSLAFLS